MQGAAVPLLDGRVLVAGGSYIDVGGCGAETRYSSAEIYDPIRDRWTRVATMPKALGPTGGLRLPSGDVLVFPERDYVDSAAIYTPATNVWRAIRLPEDAGFLQHGFLLRDGRVLLLYRDGAYAYDPASEVGEALGRGTGRWEHQATQLGDGSVVITGGTQLDTAGERQYLSTVERFDPTRGQWSTLSPMRTRRTLHVAAPIGGGRLLVAGGENALGQLAEAELYDLATDRWVALPSMLSPRARAQAAKLGDDKILILAGYSGEGTLSSAEYWCEGEACLSLFSGEVSTSAYLDARPQGGGCAVSTSSRVAMWPAGSLIMLGALLRRRRSHSRFSRDKNIAPRSSRRHN